MTTLTEFLLARIAEDERTARAALVDRTWTFEASHLGSLHGQVVSDDGAIADVTNIFDGHHMARWDPTRVLAECEAKRRIVELHSIGDGGIGKNGHWNEATQTMEPRQYWYCGNCDYDRDYGFVADEKEGCETLLLLAGVYSDHSDFNPSWAISE